MTHETHVKAHKSLIIKCMYRGHHVYKISCSSAAYFMSYYFFCNTLFLFSFSIHVNMQDKYVNMQLLCGNMQGKN